MKISVLRWIISTNARTEIALYELRCCNIWSIKVTSPYLGPAWKVYPLSYTKKYLIRSTWPPKHLKLMVQPNLRKRAEIFKFFTTKN